MIEINGKNVAQNIKNDIQNRIEENYIKDGKELPSLVCVLVGNDPASKIYVASKEKQAREIGLFSITEKLSEDSSKKDVIKTLERLNNNSSVSGILLQLPLPEPLRKFEREIVNTISPEKDVDCLTDINLGKLFADNGDIAPCTAAGIMELLKEYDVPIKGKKAVVVGRSLLVGKSVAALLLKEGATIEVCHSKTTDLKASTKTADILVCAVGKPNFIKEDMVKNGACVIDVGINRVEDKTSEKGYKVVGDVDYENVKDKCSFITPVPKGVGPMTIAMLFHNTMTLHEKRFPLEKKIAKEKETKIVKDEQNFKI